jgi:hypothetical protein
MLWIAFSFQIPKIWYTMLPMLLAAVVIVVTTLVLFVVYHGESW